MRAAIRKFLDLSTAHLPEKLRLFGSREGDPHAWDPHAWEVYVLDYGFLLWVPDEPLESAQAEEKDVPDVVLRIQLYARKHGCDYVLFDADGPVNPDLNAFEDQGEGAPPHDAATATGMYDPEGS